MKYKVLFLVVVVIIGVGMYMLFSERAEAPATISDSTDPTPIATVEYICNNEQTIRATYFEGAEAVTASDRPNPTGTVTIELSDGRTLNLKQTISASGIRYSDGDPQIEGAETFVFWSKGDGALVLENNEEQTYKGCVAVAPPVAELPNIYHDGQNGFTLLYPTDWVPNHRYQNPNTGAAVPNFHDVKFMVPSAFAADTNLSGDSGLSIEMSLDKECTADVFASQPVTARKQTIGGREYYVATSSDAGAGNFYEEYIYAFPNSSPCLAIHYFIHSTNIDNYEPGSVTAFDRTALLSQFDAIRDSFRLAE